MARLGKIQSIIVAAVCAGVLVACSGGPSKSQAMDAIQSGVREDGSCTLPVDILTKLKMQHTTKGICVPKEGAEKAKACVDALVTANITHRMPESYMVTWPDEVSGASLADIPAYDRRARNLVYVTCVELTGDLREGRFPCADVKADKILKVTAPDATHADVKYAREITLRPTLAAIDAACGTVSRPPGESTAAFVKDPATGWTLAPAAAAAH